MHTIFCSGEQHATGLFIVVALADDGNVLASHACLGRGYAEHDIGISSHLKHRHYDAHFGAGNWKLEWVEKPEWHDGYLAALALNRKVVRNEAATVG